MRPPDTVVDTTRAPFGRNTVPSLMVAAPLPPEAKTR